MADRRDPWSIRTLATCVCLLLTISQVHSDDRAPAAASGTVRPPQGNNNNNDNNNPLPDDNNNNTLLIPDMDSYSDAQLYALLVDILEKLNVLVPKTPSCYQLEKIVHETIPQDQNAADKPESNSDSQTLLGVYLYFKETPLASSSSPSSSSSGGKAGSSKSRNSSRDGRDSPGSDTKVTPSMKAGNDCVSEPHFVQSMDAQPLVRDLGNSTGGHGGRAGGVNGTRPAGGTGPQTGPNGEFQINEDEDDDNDDRFGGLSRTQVVVISTCSAIISTFFIVAFVLRVRNYIKRVREEQQQARRPTFRSCSVRLRSVSHSNEQVRRDSQISKLSHQSNLTGRGGSGGGGSSQGGIGGGMGGGGGGGSYSLTNGSCNSREHSNASSPHHDPDTKPLLLVTAVAEAGALLSQGQRPGGGGQGPQSLPSSGPHTPSGSQSSSLQFIDEEPLRTAGGGVGGGNAHRKMERGASRTLSRDDSEVRPLLASSEVSANSLHLSPTSPTCDPTSLNGDMATSNTNGLALDNTDGLTIGRSNGSVLAEGVAGGFDGPCSPGDGDSFANGGLPFQPVAVEAQNHRKTDTPSPQGSMVKTDAGTVPGEAENRDAESLKTGPPSTLGTVQIPLIRFCGLTQSDTSLSSGDGNHNYRYGTQMEYTPPDLGYFSATECINGMNTPYHAFHFLHNPTLFSASSFVPTNTPSANSGDLSPSRTPPTPAMDHGYSGSRAYSVDFTKQNSVFTDGDWYDGGGPYSPPPCGSLTDCTADDVRAAVTSESLADVQPSDTPPSAVLSSNSNAVGPGSGVCSATTDSVTEQRGARGDKNLLMDFGEHGSKDNAGSAFDGGVDSSPAAGVREGQDGQVAAKDCPPSSVSGVSPVSQTVDTVEEPSLSSVAQIHHKDHCDQSRVPPQSHDQFTNQWNTSAPSGDTDGEQRPSDVVDQSYHTNTAPASNTPDSTVVMKRLLSSEERTTFL